MSGVFLAQDSGSGALGTLLKNTLQVMSFGGELCRQGAANTFQIANSKTGT